MPDAGSRTFSPQFRAASTVSFLLIERVLRNIDRADNVAMCVEAAFTFVPTVIRLVLTPADRTALRRFVRIHIDQMNARQSRLVRDVFRESVKTP